MKFTRLSLAAIPLATAQLTFNITQALALGLGNQVTHGTRTTDTWVSRIPQCLRQCQIEASKIDGCPYDDFACRCVNTQVFSDLIEPCAFPPALGGGGTCTFAELGVARLMVQDLCNFFNATLYADYVGCPNKLNKLKTYSIIAKEGVEVTN